jgi:hypothetical protein
MAAIDPSIYRKVTIVKDGRDIDIRQGCVSIDIFESVLSPNITGIIQVVNAKGTIKDDKGDRVTLYDGLKIRGGEEVYLYIEKNAEQNERIIFIDTPLYVSHISNLYKSEQLEYFTIHLVSRQAFVNEHTFLDKYYTKDAPISNHVQDIIETSFGQVETNIDPTSNPTGFVGNQQKPFDALINLASKSVLGETEKASAGFFFYQTKSAFNFRSIDKLIMQEPKSKFVLTAFNRSRAEFQPQPDLPSLDFKIINYELHVNQALIDKLRKGAYSTFRTFFDPVTQTVTTDDQNKFTGNDYIGPMKNLGQPFEENDLSYGNVKLTDLPSRHITEIFDRGTLAGKKVVRDTTGLEIETVLSQRSVRYNSLYTQMMSVQVPLATNIEAGDIVELLFPKINEEDKLDLDSPQMSGLYMVTDIRHHFDPTFSLTTMNVARDTYGLTGTNNK